MRSFPPFVAVAAWLLPGAGHFLVGQRWRGVVLFVWLSLTFALGVAVTGGAAVSLDDHPLAFAAQIFAGLPFVAGNLLGRPARDPMAYGVPPLSNEVVASMDLGLLLTMTAGLLNLLLVLDAFDRATAARGTAVRA